MSRGLLVNLTLQTATDTDDGLEQVQSWTNGSAITATLVPAGLEERARAGAVGETITHTALLPAGLSLSTDATRFTASGTVYRIVDVTSTPAGIITTLEADQ